MSVRTILATWFALSSIFAPIIGAWLGRKR